MKYTLQKIPLFISIILFVFLCFIFWFLYRAVKNNNEKAEAGMVTLETEARRREAITSLDRTLEEVVPERTLLETHFAKSSDVVPFLDTIEQLAPKAGAVAQVDSVDMEPGDTGLIVDLKSQGTFESLYKFLTLLENSPYELEILSMDLETAGGDAAIKNDQGAEWQAVFKVKLLSFYSVNQTQ